MKHYYKIGTIFGLLCAYIATDHITHGRAYNFFNQPYTLIPILVGLITMIAAGFYFDKSCELKRATIKARFLIHPISIFLIGLTAACLANAVSFYLANSKFAGSDFTDNFMLSEHLSEYFLTPFIYVGMYGLAGLLFLSLIFFWIERKFVLKK